MLKIGDLLDGKYRILSEVGHGGMSTVYLARNERANKNWAVKEVRKNGASQYDVVKQSLLAEIEILKRLDNPHLPSIVDVIDMDDTFVIVMDFVEGNSLDKMLGKGAVPEKEVIEWGSQICDVLIYLHNLKPPIIYRDMKPSNVILRPDGVIMLLDFGTAREYKSRKAGDDTTCLGTRGYAAPEQYGGMGETDGRTDIYCLGATLYHLVTGMNPGLPPYEMKPIRQINPRLSDGLEKIILKCTRPNPAERYQSCEELKFDLEHVEEIGKKAQRKRSRNLGLFFCAVLLSLFGILGMVGFRVAANNVATSSYDYYIAQGDGAAKLDDKVEMYIRAAEVAPAREDAYEHLLNYVIEDSAINIQEVQALQKLLGQMFNENPAQAYFQKRNPEEFERFAYNLGINYYLYCDENGKSLALEWLNYAAASNSLAINEKATAESLGTIAKSYGELHKKVNSEYTFIDYWTDLTSLFREDLATRTNYYIALGIYRYTAGEIKNEVNNFKNYGDVSREELEAILGMIEERTNQIEETNRLDEEDIRLVEQIREQVKGARDRIAMAYEQ